MHVTLSILSAKRVLKNLQKTHQVLEKERREVYETELKELEEKVKKLIRTCESLKEDRTKYSFEAETKSDLGARKLLVRANALNRRQNELKIEVKVYKMKLNKKDLKDL